MADGKILVLDDYRPRVTEQMHCLFCGLTHVSQHLANRGPRYFECPGCDEVASVPEWSLRHR